MARKVVQANLTSNEGGYWLHEVARNNSTLAGVARRDTEIVRFAWKMRVKADYSDEHVNATEISHLVGRVKTILESLGVVIKESTHGP